MRARFVSSIHDISPTTWNRLCDTDYPFLKHEFFAALEDSKSTTQDTGWEAHHLLIDDDDTSIFVMPLFLKYNSYGEYVFDWAWADAYHRHGEHYYPKLLNSIPFTPATGQRWGIDKAYEPQTVLDFAFKAIEAEALEHNYSSCHWLFTNEDQSVHFDQTKHHKRSGCQYHWFNKNYSDFDHFLSDFNSRKRKNLKKERQRVIDQDIHLVIKEGADISDADWQDFFLFYHLTYYKRSGRRGYLTESFFPLLAKTMSQHIVMAQASKDNEIIAAALYFKDSQTLYGRYWGCKEEYDQLHFEACYYQGIDYAIKHELKKFDPGAQGEHKIQRGFTPTKTISYHWLVNTQFSDAVKQFVQAEEKDIENYIEQASERLPFKLPNQ